MSKVRLDSRVHELGLADSREKAKALVIAGQVSVNGQTVSKPAAMIAETDEVALKAELPFVSRGGLKLDKAMRAFGLSLEGCVAADIGASTGGFTDCMLQNGARTVYAIDVGYGQLAYALRNDPRVVVMERTNARFIQPDWFTQPLDFVSIDVSFISVRLILGPLKACMAEAGQAVVLVKPQFEAGREHVGKKGVVRDMQVHAAVIQCITEYARGAGYAICGLEYSPVRGPEGNIEFLLLLKSSGPDAWPAEKDAEMARQTAQTAHRTFSSQS